MRKVIIFKETLLAPSETFILEQMRALREYEPTLVGLTRVQPSLRLPHEPLLLSNDRASISDLRAKIYRRIGVAPRFHSRVKRLSPNLIHAHFASGGRSALALASELRLPLLVTLHGNDVTVRSRRPNLYRRLGQDASLFICVSKFIREQALAAGFPAEKLLVHYIGIDRAAFSCVGSSAPMQGVLFVGRLVEKKGCEYLLRAMQLVQRRHPQCQLTVIGDGPLRRPLEDFAGKLHVRCVFRGVQPASIVREALRTARVFCVPSVTASDGDSEGLGMVFAEAQATGLPVVSTFHGGIPEVVANHETGLLTPERDSDALADALCLLLSDDDLWQRFHRAAPPHIEQRFDLKTQTALLECIYTGMIEKK